MLLSSLLLFGWHCSFPFSLEAGCLSPSPWADAALGPRRLICRFVSFRLFSHSIFMFVFFFVSSFFQFFPICYFHFLSFLFSLCFHSVFIYHFIFSSYFIIVIIFMFLFFYFSFSFFARKGEEGWKHARRIYQKVALSGDPVLPTVSCGSVGWSRARRARVAWRSTLWLDLTVSQLGPWCCPSSRLSWILL